MGRPAQRGETRIEKLTPARLHDFLSFGKLYRGDVDESFLYDEDLRSFVTNCENPTHLAVSPGRTIVGAASVMNSPYFQRRRKGRFRIFYVIPGYGPGIPARLMTNITRDVSGLDELYLFVREDNPPMRRILESLGFYIERYAYYMVRNAPPVAPPNWEDGFVFRPMVFNRYEADYCHVRNLGFAQLPGSETLLSPEEVSRIQQSDAYIESGTFLLYHREQPVGVVRTAKDGHNGKPVMNIGPLALVPDYQGRGLGRTLLRAALSFGRNIGLTTSVLSANVDNHQAVRLYLSEGFETVEAVVCYTYRLSRWAVPATGCGPHLGHKSRIPLSCHKFRATRVRLLCSLDMRDVAGERLESDPEI